MTTATVVALVAAVLAIVYGTTSAVEVTADLLSADHVARTADAKQARGPPKRIGEL